MDADAKRPGGGGSKFGKILRTPFMDGTLGETLGREKDKKEEMK